MATSAARAARTRDARRAAEAAKISPKGKWVAWLSTPSANLKGASSRPRARFPFQLLDGTSIAKKGGRSRRRARPPAPRDRSPVSRSQGRRPRVDGNEEPRRSGAHRVPRLDEPDADHKGGAGDIAAKDATWTDSRPPRRVTRRITSTASRIPMRRAGAAAPSSSSSSRARALAASTATRTRPLPLGPRARTSTPPAIRHGRREQGRR